MTLQQLSHVKRWHARHVEDHPAEYYVFDTILTAWLMGWVFAPIALVLDAPGMLVVCLAFIAAPTLYVWMRRRLHREGRLRCDWLCSLSNRPW